jgi:REP element-mobilizing transposase RayT
MEDGIMRQPRILEEGAGYYFVTSRVVDRRFVFVGELERERVVRTLRVMEAFCGVQVLTYAILSNEARGQATDHEQGVRTG